MQKIKIKRTVNTQGGGNNGKRKKKVLKTSDYYRINVFVVKCYQENDGMFSTATHAVTLIITDIGLNGVWIDQ